MNNINYIILTITICILVIFGEFIAKNIVQYNINKSTISNTLSEIQKEDNNIDDIKYIDYLINKYSDKYNVDRSLSHSIALVESNKNQNTISKAGSIGIYQIQPQTAKHLNINPYDLNENIDGGIKYISYLSNKFNGNLDFILASYNAGPSNIIKYNGIPPFDETIRYVDKVKKEIYKIENEIN